MNTIVWIVFSSVADRPCEKGKTKCPNSNKCLARRYLCDGDDDCGDNSDENPLFCKSVACTDGKILETVGGTWWKKKLKVLIKIGLHIEHVQLRNVIFGQLWW